MKQYLTAITLGAALVQPASAVTFPSLTTIYVAAGVFDDGGDENLGFASTVSCSNVSGVTTAIRVLVLNNAGAVEASATNFSVPHGISIRFSTHDTTLPLETNLATGPVPNGVFNVEALQSAVFCTFDRVSAVDPVSGVPLHAIRVNPHPGTVE
jgi:hypothetical protein